jgi:hypothetical protein
MYNVPQTNSKENRMIATVEKGKDKDHASQATLSVSLTKAQLPKVHRACEHLDSANQSESYQIGASELLLLIELSELIVVQK